MGSVCKNTTRSKYRNAFNANTWYQGPIYSRTMIRQNDYSFTGITCPSRQSLQTYSRPIEISRDDQKQTEARQKRNRLCCVVLTTAIFLVATAVISIAGLAFYMGALTTDSTNPLITFSCSMKITRGDFYTSALKYNYTSAYREKSRRYKTILETIYQKSLLGPAFVSCAIEKFKNISLTLYFTLSFSRKKIPRSIPNAEKTIKDILINEIQSRKSLFNNIKVDTNSITVKRLLDNDYMNSYQRQDLLKPNEKTQIKNNVIRKYPNITLTANIPIKKKPTIEEPEINEDNLPVVQGSFKITKTDADITVKKNVSIVSSVPTTKKPAESTTQTTTKTTTKRTTVTTKPTVKIRTTSRPTTKSTTLHTTTETSTIKIGFSPPEFSFIDEPWKPIRRHASSEEISPTDVYRIGVVELATKIPNRPDITTYHSFNPFSISPQSQPVYKSYTNPSLSSNAKNIPLLGISDVIKHPIPVDKFSDIRVDDTSVFSEETESSIPLTNNHEDVSFESLQLEDRHGSADIESDQDGESFVEIDTLKYVPGSASSSISEETTHNSQTPPSWQLINDTNIHNNHSKTENVPNKTYNETIRESIMTDLNNLINLKMKNVPVQSLQNISTIFRTLASKLGISSLFNKTLINKDKIKIEEIPLIENITDIEETVDEPIIGHGLVEVINSSMQELLMSQPEMSTTLPLVTLIPVKSNSGLRSPLRPRPKMSERETEESRSYQSHNLIKNLIVLNNDEKIKREDTNTENIFLDEYYSEETTSDEVVTNTTPDLNSRLDYVTDDSSAVDTETRKIYLKIFTDNKTTLQKPNTEDISFGFTTESKSFEEITMPPHLEFATSISSEISLIKIKVSDYIRSLNKAKQNNTNSDQLKMDFLTTDKATTSNHSTTTISSPTIIVNVYSSITNSTNKRNRTDMLNTDRLKKLAEISNLYHNNITGIKDPVISTKAISSSYSINQAGLKILTKTFNKIPTTFKKDEVKIPQILNSIPLTVFATNGTECNNLKLKCSDGTCVPQTARCNQLIDCADGSDEKGCTCADYLHSQFLSRKICDGVVDCWDFSDENNCDWCSHGQYVCLNSRTCINKEKICDGIRDCPQGDDERNCVTVAPNPKAADEFPYNSKGYLMIRKYGNWGKLCTENFEKVVEQSHATWHISDLGRAICKAMTYRDLEYIERTEDDPKNKSYYFELAYSYQMSAKSNLSFEKSECRSKEIVKVKCKDLECGTRPETTSHWARIVGGTNANLGSWPWQAALYKEGDFQCGATLISDTWLVSAGHCFYQAQTEFWVARLGALRRGATFPSPYEQIRPISKIILHPNYVNAGFINDIAILKIKSPVIFSDYVRPICLPSPNSVLKNGRICTVVGWGQLFEVGRIFPDTLQEVQLPIISASDCRKKTLFLPLYLVTDDMFCAGYERGGRDACLGDSGGPLMCQENDNRWSLYGITSNGFGCARASLPGVYTKVANYVEWIYSHVNNTDLDDLPEVNHPCRGHRCPLGECLPKSRVCNGYIECNDGSDEKDCFQT